MSARVFHRHGKFEDSMVRALAVLGLSCVFACGPGHRVGDNGPPDATAQCIPTAAENTPETCSDGIDNDCNGLTDCTDPSCSGIGGCPVCGMIQHPLPTPLALPDGVGGHSCTTDANCATVTPGPQHCFTVDHVGGSPVRECRQSYTSKLHFSGFPSTGTFTAVSNIQSVCINAEHSWLADLQIDLVSPSGQRVQLQKMLGQTGGEIYLGLANDCDDDAHPVPGVGADYCWTPTAAKPDMLAYANSGAPMASAPICGGPDTANELPPGDYSAADPWTHLIGSDLNGDWELVITDLWEIDNGYLFSWSIGFDPQLVESCDPPIQ